MYYTSIKDVEQVVGRSADNVDVREKEVVLTFASPTGAGGKCHLGEHDFTTGGDLRFHIKRW